LSTGAGRWTPGEAGVIVASPNKRKGTRAETEFARLVGGKRVPLSGALEELPGDVEWPGVGTGEVKRRKDGFAQLYGWLADNDFLALRRDRDEWLVVLRAKDLQRLLGDSD